jgi:hypothetical protein
MGEGLFVDGRDRGEIGQRHVQAVPGLDLGEELDRVGDGAGGAVNASLARSKSIEPSRDSLGIRSLTSMSLPGP